MTSVPDRLQRLTPFLWVGVRTGLAIVLAIGIALAMDWQRPQWAGIAVMSVSQDSGSATLGKGVLRLLATLGAAVAALTLIALFPQDRWGFFLALSLYVGLCGYHMLGSRHAYAWRVAAYVGPVIAISAGSPDAANDFTTAIERLLENVTGVATIVGLGLAVRSSGSLSSFEDRVRSLAGNLADLLGHSIPTPAEHPSEDAGRTAAASALRDGLARYETWLQEAIEGSFRIRQQRGSWRLLRSRFAELLAQIESWRLSLLQLSAEAGGSSLERAPALNGSLRQLRAAAGSLQRRWQQLAQPGSPFTDPQAAVASAPLQARAGGLETLPAQDRAALTLAWEQWQRIERTGRALEELHERLQQDPRRQPSPVEEEKSAWALNPDHLRTGIRLMLGIWMAALLWIFVPDLPGGAAIVTLTAVFSVVCALAEVPASKVLPALLISLLPAGLLYVFVLPKLEGFTQLAILLFVYTVAAFLVAGKQRPLRTLAVDFLLITFGITNQQTFSFIGFLDRTLAIIISFAIIILLQEMISSTEPTRQYNQGLIQLQKSVLSLCAWLALPRSRHPLRRWLRQQHLTFLKQELGRLPDKLERSSRSLTPASTGCSTETITRMNAATRAIALWTLELERVGTDPAVRRLIMDVAGGTAEAPPRQRREPADPGWHDVRKLMVQIEDSALGPWNSVGLPLPPGEQALDALAAVSRGLADSIAILLGLASPLDAPLTPPDTLTPSVP